MLAPLYDKHPPPHPNSCIPAAPTPVSLIHLSKEEVAKSIASFLCGSTAGPDVLYPPISEGHDGQNYRLCMFLHMGSLRLLTKFINLVLKGWVAPTEGSSLWSLSNCTDKEGRQSETDYSGEHIV